MGDAQGAADELAGDLYQMKGDRYAQDELLSEVDSDETKSVGADIQLNSWIRREEPGMTLKLHQTTLCNIPITAYDYNDPSLGQ